jgi:hypothetical protein
MNKRMYIQVLVAAAFAAVVGVVVERWLNSRG